MKKYRVQWVQEFSVVFDEEIEASSARSAEKKARKMAKDAEIDVSCSMDSAPLDDGDDFVVFEDWGD